MIDAVIFISYYIWIFFVIPSFLVRTLTIWGILLIEIFVGLSILGLGRFKKDKHYSILMIIVLVLGLVSGLTWLG
jgi:hypothetical protein